VKSISPTTGRIFAGLVNDGPSAGFTAANLQVEILSNVDISASSVRSEPESEDADADADADTVGGRDTHTNTNTDSNTNTVWRPDQSDARNLNGTYPNLDCYSVPASCVQTNQARMGKGRYYILHVLASYATFIILCGLSFLPFWPLSLPNRATTRALAGDS
jgi:hypothetical protein